MTAAELARATGLSESTCRRYQRGMIPALPIAHRIAAALGITLNEVALRKATTPAGPSRGSFGKKKTR